MKTEMSCSRFQAQLDEYLAGELPPFAVDEAGLHLHGCESCQRQVARRQALRAALRSQPVPAPRSGFIEQALTTARNSEPAHRSRWMRLAGAAVAASLAVWVGVAGLPGIFSTSDRSVAGVSMALHETRTVQLSFNAERELSGAMLHLQLPEGVELRGFPGKREIRWRTDLARGVNMLSLPLMAVASTDGALKARLEHGDRSTEMSVRIVVSRAGKPIDNRT